ncbi:MAG: hypothetical protein E6552_05960, partial [Sutterella wadsworthensis]|nr:hypothetical protein [Sutterella wadsworthensis]
MEPAGSFHDPDLPINQYFLLIISFADAVNYPGLKARLVKAGLVDQPKFFENYVADRFKTHLGMLPQFRALEASEADKHWVRTKRSEAKCRSV